MACVFCRIAQGQAPAHRVYEDESVVAFMDIRPVTPGHLLVIPKVHADTLYTLDEETWRAVCGVGQRLVCAVKAAMGCAGVNLWLANEPDAGQAVMHVHLHVVPRFPDDGLQLVRRTDPNGDDERLAEHAEAIGRILGASRSDEELAGQ